MKKILVFVGAALVLTGCGSYRTDDAGNQEPRNLIVQEVEVDGQDVTCVVYDDSEYSQGGLSCDWSS